MGCGEQGDIRLAQSRGRGGGKGGRKGFGKCASKPLPCNRGW
jgi:hypothetical protein